jgi:hypothetical protein
VLVWGPHSKSSVDLQFKFVTSAGIQVLTSSPFKGIFFVYSETILKAGLSCNLVGPRSVVWLQRQDLVRLQGQTAEYKPRPLLICILVNAIVFYFHNHSASTTMAAEMRHAHSRIVVKAPCRDLSYQLLN